MTTCVGVSSGASRSALTGASGTAGCPSAPEVAYDGQRTVPPGANVIAAAGVWEAGASLCAVVQPASKQLNAAASAAAVATRPALTPSWSPDHAAVNRQVIGSDLRP